MIRGLIKKFRVLHRIKEQFYLFLTSALNNFSIPKDDRESPYLGKIFSCYKSKLQENFMLIQIEKTEWKEGRF